MSDPLPEYRSGEEFALILSRMAAQLHAKNRIWIGESGYAWHVAVLLEAIGQDFAEGISDKTVHQQFGGAYQTATLSAAEQQDELFNRLRRRLMRGAPLADQGDLQE